MTNSFLDTSSKLVNQLSLIVRDTRNIIIYGPPGTGKTYIVNKFARFFLQDQLEEALPSDSIPLDSHQRSLINYLKWHEIIALSMYLKLYKDREGQALYESEIVENKIIKAYCDSHQIRDLRFKIRVMLKVHSGTAGYFHSMPPFLFENHNQLRAFQSNPYLKEDRWSLSIEGSNYVKENFGNILDEFEYIKEFKPQLSDYMRFVAFHQSFSYEEFVEGLKPIMTDDGKIRYEVRSGVFKEICRLAQNDPDHDYLLVIDEINRANIAKVFGELTTLIEDDKRLGEKNEISVQLPYSQETFGVPQNLLILGTMNTADRSIALLDIALRRRFTFVEQMPDPSLLRSISIEGLTLSTLLEQINQRITVLLGRDYQIGHSYLMGVTTVADLHFAWYRRIMPLLQEYFYNDWERLKVVVGDGFVKPTRIDNKTRQALGDFYAPERQFEICTYDAGPNFLNTLKAIVNA